MNNRISEENLRICPICNAMYDATKINIQHCSKCKNNLNPDYLYLCKIVDYQTYLSMMKNREIQSYKALFKEVTKNTLSSNLPKCPTCGSTNVRPISSLNRAGSMFMWGIMSSKIGKTYECLNCKYKW